jgi:ParB family chromosome partitioning protein
MATATDTQLAHIELDKIRENKDALRIVNRKTESYLELVDSIKNDGILNPIVVTPAHDADTGEDYFTLVDGLHRYTAATDCGLDKVPAHIMSMEDQQILYSQIIANVHKVETKPVEYSKQLQKILSYDPVLTSTQLASKLGKSTAWLNDRLGLLKLADNIAPLVDEGKINLSNAFALAKLPVEEQANFTDRAMTMTPQEFTPTIVARKKELDQARRKGRDATPEQFIPVPSLRKLKELKEEHENKKVGPVLVKAMKCKTAADGFAAGVAWTLKMDPNSVEAARKKDEERRASLKAKRETASQDRIRVRAQDAQVRATRLQIEADVMSQTGDAEKVAEALAEFDKKNGLVDGKKPKAADKKD